MHIDLCVNHSGLRKKKRCIFSKKIMYLRTHWAEPLKFGIKWKVKDWATLWFMFKFRQTGGEPPSSLNIQKFHEKKSRLVQIIVNTSALIHPTALNLVLTDRKKDCPTSWTMFEYASKGGGGPPPPPLHRIMKKIIINVHRGQKKKLISPLLVNLWYWFWYQSIPETKPHTLNYITISSTEGGAPQRKKSDILAKQKHI